MNMLRRMPLAGEAPDEHDGGNADGGKREHAKEEGES